MPHNSPTQNPHLIHFLQSWLEWAEGGAQPTDYLALSHSRWGLCGCIEDYAEIRADEVNEVADTIRWEIEEALDEFWDCSEDYPFGRMEFLDRQRDRTQHRDPNRLAWVRAQLKIEGAL